MIEVKLWVVLIACSVLATVLGLLLKWGFGKLIEKIDELIKEIKSLTINQAVIDTRLNGIDKSINDHENRLRKLEDEQ